MGKLSGLPDRGRKLERAHREGRVGGESRAGPEPMKS